MMSNANRVGTLVAMGVLLAGAIHASAQVDNPGDPNRRLWTPLAAGTFGPANGGVSGTWYAYETSSNAYGFFLRGYSSTQNSLFTIVPYETLADGRVQFWYIEYGYDNAADPEDTHWWSQRSSGRVVLGPGTGLPGTGWTIQLYRTIGSDNVPVQDQWRQVTFNLTAGSLGGGNPQPQPSSCSRCNANAGCLCLLGVHMDGCPGSK